MAPGKKWHWERLAKIVKQDLRDLESVKDIDKMELLAEELPRRTGSPLSVNSLSQDLEVDPKTTKRWLGILDALYYCFQIAPLGSPQIRAVKKEQKLYLWDWSQIEEPGIRFENMMACQLLKYCHFHEDVDGYKMELRYLRDTDKREVDFVVLKNKKPCFAVECKLKAMLCRGMQTKSHLNLSAHFLFSAKDPNQNFLSSIVGSRQPASRGKYKSDFFCGFLQKRKNGLISTLSLPFHKFNGT